MKIKIFNIGENLVISNPKLRLLKLLRIKLYEKEFPGKCSCEHGTYLFIRLIEYEKEHCDCAVMQCSACLKKISIPSGLYKPFLPENNLTSDNFWS